MAVGDSGYYQVVVDIRRAVRTLDAPDGEGLVTGVDRVGGPSLHADGFWAVETNLVGELVDSQQVRHSTRRADLSGAAWIGDHLRRIH
jgi:hypothetical protein